jgi:hypothetical protein
MSGHQTTTTTRWPDCPASKAAYSATRIHRMRLHCTCVAAAKRLQAYISTRHQPPVIYAYGVYSALLRLTGSGASLCVLENCPRFTGETLTLCLHIFFHEPPAVAMQSSW